MTESEFIGILGHELGETEGWEDIVRDYREHFQAGRAAGRGEEEIAASLGRPEDIAREFRSQGRGIAPDSPEAGSPLALETQSEERRLFRAPKPLVLGLMAALGILAVGLGARAIVQAERGRRAAEGIDIRLPGMEVHVGGDGVHTKVGGTDVKIGEGVDSGTSTVIDSNGGGSGLRELGIYEERPSLPYSSERRLGLRGVERISIYAYVADVKFLRVEEGKDLGLRLSGVVAAKYADELGLEASTTGREVSIGLKRPSQFDLHGSKERLLLEVELPKDYAKDLRIETLTGSIAFDGGAASLSLSTETGDIDLARPLASSIRIASSTGDVAIQGCAGGLDIQTETGDVELSPEKLAATKVRTDTGDVRLEIGGGAAFTYKVASQTGELSVQGREAAEEAHRLEGRIGTGGPELDIESQTGDILID